MNSEERMMRDPEFYVRVQKMKMKLIAAMLFAAWLINGCPLP